MPEMKTILCVDDERDVVESLHDTFMDDYKVLTALSGQEALEIFENNDIALVISDQRMPGMEGTELLKQINDKKPICKKILLTGYADINAAIDSINKSGVDRYFNKPWDDEELLTAVRHLLKMYDMDSFMSRALAERKGFKAQKQEAEAFSAFLNSWQEGVCVVDDNQTILYCNPKGLEILQIANAADIIGKKYQMVIPLSQGQEDAFTKKGPLETAPLQLTVKFDKGDNIAIQATLHGEGKDSSFRLNGIVFTAN